MGMFVSAGQMIPSNILVSNEKYSLNDEQQAEQNEKINSLIALYAIQNATVSGDVEKVVEFSVRHASKKDGMVNLNPHMENGLLQAPAWKKSGVIFGKDIMVHRIHKLL